MSIEGFFPRGSSSGSGDPATVARSVENKTKIDEVSKTAGQTVAAGQVTLNYGKIWKNDTAGALTVGADDAGMVAEGFTESTQEQIDEIVVSTADLAGAAPAGAKEGINTTTGAEFYVMAGNWVASPVAADLPRLPSLQASADFTPDIASSVSMADLEKLVRNHTPQMFPADPNTKDIVLKAGPLVGYKEYTLTFGSNVTFTDAPTGASTAGGNHVTKMRWEGPGGTNQDGRWFFWHRNTDGTVVEAYLNWASGAAFGDWVIVEDVSTADKVNWDGKEDELPKDTALRFLRRNAANDGWELTDIVVTSQNLTSGPGTPGAGDGNDGDYWLQLDAALGTNDIWGPKAAGAWPAQADFKSADPEETTPAQAVSTTGTDYTTPRLWSTENQDQWGISRRVQRIFNSGPIFDYSTLNYIDKTAIFVRNPDNANGVNVDAGAGVSVEVTNADGSIETVTQNANIQPGEIGVFEKDGTNARLNVFPGERVKRFASYAAANAFGPLPFDGLVLITDKREVWARISATNTALFPADGVPDVHWDIYGVSGNFVQQGTTTEKNALGVVDPSTPFFDTVLGKLQRYNTSTEVFSVTKAATDLPALVEFAGANSVFSAMQFKITTSLADTVDNPTITLPSGQDTLLYIIGQQFFNGTASTNTLGGGFTVRNDNGVLTLVSVEPDRHWGSGLDWATIPYTALPNTVAGPVDITLADANAIFTNVPGAGAWVDTSSAAASDDWVLVADGGNFEQGKVSYQLLATDTGVEPTLTAGQWFSFVRPDASGKQIATYKFHDGTAVQTIENAAASTLDIVRYTADGPIQDKDHRAIFEAGAVNMTLPVSTQDRLIQIISEGPATVITANGSEQFTGPAGTTVDSTLNVNETFQWATLLGRGAAAGWSQYVGQVATAQSVGSMVDFSESPGPGDAASFSLALTNSGANLRHIISLTCSNGTNFSPPLDTDDGVNRWWYDFDHTTGTVNIRRFGAFSGGSVRGVALYS